MRKLILFPLLFAWILCPLKSRADNIVNNPSFETSLTEWTITGSFTGSLVYSYDGSRSFYALPSTPYTTVSQTIATTPGQRYDLSFWLMNLSRNPPAFVEVSWGSAPVLTLTDTPLWIPFASSQWHNYVVPSLEAAGTSTTLQFTLYSTSGLLLDLVSLEPSSAGVPEPASAILLGSGLFAAFWLHRFLLRRRLAWSPRP